MLKNIMFISVSCKNMFLWNMLVTTASLEIVDNIVQIGNKIIKVNFEPDTSL